MNISCSISGLPRLRRGRSSPRSDLGPRLAWTCVVAIVFPALPRADEGGAHSASHASAARSRIVQSAPGENPWNQGRPPQDWWGEVKRQHGHVGPWNVLGWRIGQAALKELGSGWGLHELDMICYVPLKTPFTCLADGLAVGTGNSLGRLDLRLVEVLTWQQSFVAAKRKDGEGGVLEFRPSTDYLESILNQPVEKLEGLSLDAVNRPETELFRVQRADGQEPQAK